MLYGTMRNNVFSDEMDIIYYPFQCWQGGHVRQMSCKDGFQLLTFQIRHPPACRGITLLAQLFPVQWNRQKLDCIYTDRPTAPRGLRFGQFSTHLIRRPQKVSLTMNLLTHALTFLSGVSAIRVLQLLRGPSS